MDIQLKTNFYFLNWSVYFYRINYVTFIQLNKLFLCLLLFIYLILFKTTKNKNEQPKNKNEQPKIKMNNQKW